jgi:hypothetical protein
MENQGVACKLIRHGMEYVEKKMSTEKLFIASSLSSLGASVWWPNKDHMYDELKA